MENSALRKWLILAALLGLLMGSGILVYHYYSYLFAREVDGRVEGVSRISGETEGFVVALRQEGLGTITAKTDDPRWALVQPGQCAKAKFFPNPPWNLGDAGTYFRATLLLIRDCEPGAATPASPVPVTNPEPPIPVTPATEIPGAPHNVAPAEGAKP